MDSVKINPRKAYIDINLAQFGYKPFDVVYLGLKGDYRPGFESFHTDSSHNSNIVYGTTDFRMSSTDFHRFTLIRNEDPTIIRIVNNDRPLSDNTDPDGDYILYIRPGLFSGFDNRVDFNRLSAKQAEAIERGEQITDALEGNDVVRLPNIANYGAVSWSEAFTFYGHAGSDIITGGNGNDSIHGNNDNDILTGGAGNDVLIGGSGADQLTGGRGKDTMYGNALTMDLADNAQDTFIFTAVAETSKKAALADTIYRFETGIDKIDLSAIDANAGQSGDQAFIFQTSGVFVNGVAGQVVAKSVNGDVQLRLDMNGDRLVDAMIVVKAVTALTEADLIL